MHVIIFIFSLLHQHLHITNFIKYWSSHLVDKLKDLKYWKPFFQEKKIYLMKHEIFQGLIVFCKNTITRNYNVFKACKEQF